MDRNTNSSVTSRSTDSLLGKGHTPGYGLSDSHESYKNKRSVYSDNPERWQVVAFCVLTVCIASMVAGMSLSFSSIIINELNTSATVEQQWRVDSEGTEASLIGVSEAS